MAERKGSMAYFVLAVCTGLNIVSRGIAESFAVFLLPLSHEFNASRSDTTLTYSVFMLALGLSSPLTGWAVDRYGPQRVYQGGLALSALACLLASFAPTLAVVYLTIGVLLPLGISSMGTIAASNLVSRWFKTGLPTAMGLLAAALGTGILIFAPISQTLVDRFGWRNAYALLAAFLLTLWCVQFALPWGQMRAGAASPLGKSAGHGLRGLVRLAVFSPMFWALFGIMFVTSVSTYAITVQLIAYLVWVGLSPIDAAWVFGASGLASILGMLGAGYLAKQWGEFKVASLSYTATVMGLVLLGLYQSMASWGLLLGFVLLFGAVQGSRGPLVAVLAARSFSGSHQSTMYGLVLIGMGLGGALGSWASAAFFDRFQSYLPMLLLSAVAALAGWLIFWWMTGPSHLPQPHN